MADDSLKSIGVLIIQDDPTSLDKLENMFLQRKYKVIKCKLLGQACELLVKNKERIDIVICNINDESDGFKNMKAIACDMKIIVAMMPMDVEADKLIQVVECLCMHKDSQTTIDGVAKDVQELCHDPNMNNEKKQIRESSEESSNATKKLRVVWDSVLHQKFVEAVKSIGIDDATPKQILDLMGEDWLTRANIASHLQKYRQSLLRERNLGMALAGVEHRDMQEKEQHTEENRFIDPKQVANNMIQFHHSATSLPQLDLPYPPCEEQPSLSLIQNFQIPASHIQPDLTNIIPIHAYIPQPIYPQSHSINFYVGNSSHQHRHITNSLVTKLNHLQSHLTFLNSAEPGYLQSPMANLHGAGPSHQQSHMSNLDDVEPSHQQNHKPKLQDNQSCPQQGHLRTNSHAHKPIHHVGKPSHNANEPSHETKNKSNSGCELNSSHSFADNMDFNPNLIL